MRRHSGARPPISGLPEIGNICAKVGCSRLISAQVGCGRLGVAKRPESITPDIATSKTCGTGMNPTPSPSAGCRNNACDARCCVLEQTGNRRRSMRALGTTNVVGRGYWTRGRAVAPQEITCPKGRAKRVHERFAQCPSRTNPSARFGLSHAAIILPKVSAVFCLY
jgi:hypothetical protein